MILAIDGTERITATPGARALCPCCRAAVVAKCGRINVWHWAHMSSDCDPWSEPIGPWHLEWQRRYPAHMREVVVGPHRADVRLDSGTVIEFQRSPLSVDEIRCRERFYGRMVWVFDVRSAVDEGRLDLRRKKGRDENYRTFRWKQPRRTVKFCRRPVFLDVGNGQVLKLKWMSSAAPYGGCGYLYESGRLVPSAIEEE